ncbi:hypothetical protein JNB_18598 [Janibacter sp. HTCC2649]|uniref:FG-GAP-like repeat-containing protein n=1 Tax=Janibacter sp. HTCC2649 TaxID=313589 RepID=UPI0000670F9A|nr:FG-GAP-like repeat-containing protein [Janibacter sp. HTCC2649]EAP97508.1 hypothetical protein JNB_18598 [Janibacter sp. HTCC2649]
MGTGIRAATASALALSLPAALLLALPARATESTTAIAATTDPHRSARFTPAAQSSDQAKVSGPDREEARKHRVEPVVTGVATGLTVRGVTSAVGVTWSGATPRGVLQWRFLPTSGEVGTWSELPLDAHGPDAGSAEAAGARRASEPLLTTQPGSVELRVLGGDTARTTSLRVTVDEAGAAPVDAAPTSRSATAPDATQGSQDSQSAAGAAAPTILTRAAWGADESLRKGEPSYGAVKGEVVHHTVNANTYAADQVPSIIRAIYDYHVNHNGWNDIGYNFLIDRFGRTWEGRYGGIARPVVGAHSPGVNSWTTSAAAIGTFTSSGTTVPTAITTAYTKLFAWKASLHQLDPDWTVNLGGKTQRSISGHRDNVETECPGAALYARIPAITTATSAATPNTPALTVRRDADNAGDNDVLTLDGSQRLALVHADGAGALQAPEVKTSLAPAGFDMLRVAGDWDGDGAVDVLGRLASNGGLYLYPGDGTGGFRTPVKVGTGWNTMRIMTSVGDVTGDRVPDLLAATSSDSELRVYPGDGKGSFLKPKVVGYRWNGIRSIVGVGDWDRDGDSDVLGITTAGVPLIYGNAGGGVLSNGPQLNFVAPQGSVVMAIGDATSDSLSDLVVKDASGTVRVAAGTADPSVIRWVTQSPETVTTWRGLKPFEG